jgi:hypothetical protein
VKQVWVLRCFFKPVEVVGVLAEINEVAARVVRVGPGDDEHRVIMTTFNGPLREHLFMIPSLCEKDDICRRRQHSVERAVVR